MNLNVLSITKKVNAFEISEKMEVLVFPEIFSH